MAKRRPAARSPIACGKPHLNDRASLSFGATIIGAVQDVRKDIAILAKRQDISESAPGAIHALRKLCEGEEASLSIHEEEVLRWRETIFQWWDAVADEIPRGVREEYCASLEDDFRVILASAGGSPVMFSPREADVRYIQVPFDSDEALAQARSAADRQFPVRRGSALHEYLKECIHKLVGDPQ
jgi:hypothetical protein